MDADKIADKTRKLTALLDSPEPHEVFASIQALKKIHGRSALEIFTAHIPKTDKIENLEINSKQIKKYNDLLNSYRKLFKDYKNLKTYRQRDKAKFTSELNKAKTSIFHTEMESNNIKSKIIHNKYKESVEDAIREYFGDSILGESLHEQHFVPTQKIYEFFTKQFYRADVTKVMFSKVFKKVYSIDKSYRSNNKAALSGMRILVKENSKFYFWLLMKGELRKLRAMP